MLVILIITFYYKIAEDNLGKKELETFMKEQGDNMAQVLTFSFHKSPFSFESVWVVLVYHSW